MVCVQMLRKPYRLRSNSRIQELRREGEPFSNRWLVLVKATGDGAESRFAFSISGRIGTAVVRNQIKRWTREAVRRRLPSILEGWDVVLIARQSSRQAQFRDIDWAVADLLERSHLQVRGFASALSSEERPSQLLCPRGMPQDIPGEQTGNPDVRLGRGPSRRPADHAQAAQREAGPFGHQVYMKKVALGLIWLYQHTLSRALPPSCRFVPSCSQYGYQAIDKYCLLKGGWLAVKRIARCHPLHPGGWEGAA